MLKLFSYLQGRRNELCRIARGIDIELDLRPRSTRWRWTTSATLFFFLYFCLSLIFINQKVSLSKVVYLLKSRKIVAWAPSLRNVFVRVFFVQRKRHSSGTPWRNGENTPRQWVRQTRHVTTGRTITSRNHILLVIFNAQKHILAAETILVSYRCKSSGVKKFSVLRV